MLNDRNDMPDDHEENEYHFSDEDVSYEVETESSKPASTQPKESILNRLMQSKRMIISLVVFLVLVFVVYKLVTPNSSSVSTEISAPVTTAAQTPAPSQTMQQQLPSQTQPPVTQAQQQMVPPASQPETTAPAVEVAVTPPAGVVTPSAQPTTMTAPPQTTPEAAPQQQTVASMPPVIAVQQPPVQQMPQNETSSANMPMNNMPVTAPMNQAAMQPNNPPNNPAQPPMPSATTTQTMPVDVATARMTETNDKLMAQLQSDYTQKFNDYAAQNKMLQDQMQSLSARVSTMEAQLSQLVQALTPQAAHQSTMQAPAPQGAMPPSSMMPPKPVISAPEPRVAYSVQAIIPGRAWLRSESGEAVTVAEGDTIKDLGRVTKIDPYDGVVEVNTGTRSVSLSYGNGNE